MTKCGPFPNWPPPRAFLGDVEIAISFLPVLISLLSQRLRREVQLSSPLLLRYRDGQLLSTGRNGSDRYEGATVDRPSLIIRSVSKEDIGDYACFLENEVGVGESRNMTTLEAFCE